MNWEERIARIITRHEPRAPDPDAPILMGMKPMRAWEGRRAQAVAVLDELRAAGWQEPAA
mgnify:CR=1 FL=1